MYPCPWSCYRFKDEKSVCLYVIYTCLLLRFSSKISTLLTWTSTSINEKSRLCIQSSWRLMMLVCVCLGVCVWGEGGVSPIHLFCPEYTAGAGVGAWINAPWWFLLRFSNMLETPHPQSLSPEIVVLIFQVTLNRKPIKWLHLTSQGKPPILRSYPTLHNS